MTEGKRLRQVKSFVKREGRLTPGQQKALDVLWPKFGIEADNQPIDMQTLFGRDAPVVFEIGFGNGASLIEMAIHQPENDFIGVEVHRPGVGQLLKAIEENNLSNVRVACTDAVELLKNQVVDNALHRVQLYFPDPWHKIQSGGFLHMATDWQDYAEQMLQDLSASHDFINTSTSDDFIPRPDYRPLTKFEQRGHRLGHGVWDLLFQRR